VASASRIRATDPGSLLVASNRGPYGLRLDGHGRGARVHGSGGLAPSLAPLVAAAGATWVFATSGEATALRADSPDLRLERGRLVPLAFDEAELAMAYDVVANATLWPLHHHLFDLARAPRLDRHWHRAWEAFSNYNERFAEALAELAAPGATVLIHDYHLCLAPAMLTRRRSDLAVVHFTHTPFASPCAFVEVLPEQQARALLRGLSAARACGFHASRWADAYVGCCEALGVQPAPTFVSPLAPDPQRLAARSHEEGVEAARRELDALVADRKAIVRVDRIDPAKNLLRGLWALDELLESSPRWRERIVHVVLAYPSRERLAAYSAYRSELERLADALNAKWGTSSWVPIVLDVRDDPSRSLAALERFDVLLVNPVRDGLNLVAMEGVLLNRRDGVIVLSRHAGVADCLGHAALIVNPFDVHDTAAALDRALAMEPKERRERAEQLRGAVETYSTQRWLDHQLEAAHRFAPA
jgi:trehalose 6-phosphate synthase